MGNVQTRHMDAKGMAHRRGSIAWNFRYPSVRRRDHATMMVYNAKLSVTDWLDLLDLQQYESNLQMYNRVEDILELTDNDLKLNGIRNATHRSKMLSSLVGVKAKRRQSMNIEASSASHATAKRKNSCPPMYLSQSDNIFTAQPDGAHSSPPVHGHVTHPNSRRSSERKRLTFCDTNMIYEELKTPEEQPQTLVKPNSAAKMENGTTTGTGAGAAENTTSGKNAPNSILPATQLTNEQQEAIALKKALEWELSLESRDLRSHAWYHGPLPRQRAEEIVQRDGDFLIRDCASQPDNYVLTCRSKGSVLHFVINKIILQPETVYERVQYQFEEDAFDAVPDLITFYVGSGKPISAASGALIQYPCNRTYPLSFYGHKIVGNQLHTQMLAGLRGASPLNSPCSSQSSFRFGASATQQIQQQQQQTQSLAGSPTQQQTLSPLSSPPRVRRDTPPRLPSKKQRSQSLTPAQAMVVSNMRNAEHAGSGDGIILSSPDANDTCNTNGNANGYREAPRRPCHLEKANSIAGSPIECHPFERLNAHNQKLPGNGFQTIARCSVSEPLDHVKFTTHSLPRPATNAMRMGQLPRHLNRDFPTSQENGGIDGQKLPELTEKNEPVPSPPPKPNRAPNLPRKERDIAMEQQCALQRAAAAAAAAAVGMYHTSGSDSGNGSGDSVQSSIPGDLSSEFSMHRGVIIKNPRFMSHSASSATLKSFNEFDVAMAEDQLFMLEMPEFKATSKFDFENFSTLLLPSIENKPLDSDALQTFKLMLLETGPKMIAEHITRIDVALLIAELPEPLDDNERNVLDCCGLEMLTLPHAKLFRQDLVERTQCIKLMVAVTILTCQTDLDRAELLSKWVQIAVETKTALGNLFGFASIMLGLCMQQIQKLDQAWHILRQKYTDSAFTFEAKLRPTLISMNECANPQAPNTTVPHVLLYALLKDRPILDILNTNNTADRPSLYTTCITSWESKADDFGMTINFLHLDSGRNFLKHLTMYRKNAKIVLDESAPRLDELLLDAFRTEFHVKFLWGSKGALATAADRHAKLEKVLALMADKFCNVDNNTANA